MTDVDGTVVDDATWARAEAKALCEQVVTRLRPAQLAALQLRFVEGLTLEQGARRLGISTSAFEARVGRAVRAARRTARALGLIALLVLAFRSGAPRSRGLRLTGRQLGRPATRLAAGLATTLVAPATAAALMVVGTDPGHRLAAPLASRASASLGDSPETSTIVDAMRLSANTVVVLAEGQRCACGLVFASCDAGRTWSMIPGPPQVSPSDRLAVTRGQTAELFISRPEGATYSSAAISVLAARSEAGAEAPGGILVGCDRRAGHMWCGGRRAPIDSAALPDGDGWILMIGARRIVYDDGRHRLRCSLDGGVTWRPSCGATS